MAVPTRYLRESIFVILTFCAIPSEQDIETTQYALISVRNDIGLHSTGFPGFASGGLQLNQDGVVRESFHRAGSRRSKDTYSIPNVPVSQELEGLEVEPQL